MQRDVAGAGSLLLRGLGPSGLLVTRGLGSGALVVLIERPRRRGAHGPRAVSEHEEVRCYFARVSLISVNGDVLGVPLDGQIKVCYGVDRFTAVGALPSVSRRTSRLTAGAKLVALQRRGR